jgi:MFS family permease
VPDNAAPDNDPVVAAAEFVLTTGDEATGAKSRGGPFASLRIPAYRWWFSSQLVSASGSMTQAVGVSWLVLQLTGRGIDLAILSAATMLPVLIGGAWGGSLADRFDRRRLLIVTQSIFVTLAVTLTVLSAAGAARVWNLLIISAITGTVMAADMPARQVYVVDLVGADRLGSAVGLFEIILNASRIVGPALGGLLLLVSGPTACFAVNAVSFVAPLWVLLRYRGERGHGGGRPKESQRGKTREGARYVWSHPQLRSLVVLAAASGVLFNATVLFPLLAVRALGLGGGGFGALLAFFGLGALPGALIAARATGEPSGRLVRALALATGISMCTTAYAGSAVMAFATMAVTGFLSIWFIAAANTLAQLRSSPEMRGRVMGIWSMALPGTSPITGSVAALIADHFGARVGFATAGAMIALAALTGWRALSGRARDPAATEAT